VSSGRTERVRGRFGVRASRGLLGAVAFLTIVPVPARAFGDEPFDLTPALPWFPVVGAAVGAAAGGVIAGLGPVIGRGASAVLGIATIVLVTGALHQDGLADTFDGFGVRGDRARRLAVMRDSTIGTYGALALIVWALLLLTALDRIAPVHALRTLIAAEALARLTALLHGAATRPARAEGLGTLLPSGRLPLIAAVVLGVGIAVAAAGPARAALACGVAAALAVATAALARRALGGSTGDTLGMTAAITEALVCVAVAATWR
jgi:adenosylcobinamide-GDP ribazoletransferase